MMQPAALFVLMCTSVIAAEGANILAVFPHTGKSHYFMFRPFVRQLAARGHHVTLITHFPDQTAVENITLVDIRDADEQVLFNSFNMTMVEGLGQWSGLRPLASLFGLYQMGVDVCAKGLAHPNFQSFLKKPNKFDVAIIEFFNTDCFASLSHVYQVPIIGIFSSVMMPWHNARFANPDNPAYIPNHFLQLGSEMTLVERMRNTLMYVLTQLTYAWVFDRAADALVAQHVGPDVPSVRHLVNNASLYLLNTHLTLFQPRPQVPAIVEVGGFHVLPANPANIPPHILQFIESAEHGVVFFSLGSTLRASTMAEDKVRVFQRVLGRLKQKVLWKWELDSMPDKPDNVLISKWFPQNDILGHKNVKLFITHSGLMGTEEAVYHGVPMLMMPIFGDQPVNAAACEEKGIGLTVDYFSLTDESLQLALHRLLTHSTFSEKAKDVGRMFMDRPVSTLDTAIYWTEYVIRYAGATHLRSAANRLYLYQYLLLDVIAAYALIIYLLSKLACCACRLFCTHSKTKHKVKNN